MKRNSSFIIVFLAILLVLVTMVACKNEVKKPVATATIPTEAGAANAAPLGQEETAVITQIFTDLAELVSNVTGGNEKGLSRGESLESTTGSGKLSFSAPDGVVEAEAEGITTATLNYSDFHGEAVLEDKETLSATVDFKVTIEETTKAYQLIIQDFELDDFDLKVDGVAIDKEAPANDDVLYYAHAVFYSGLSNLHATFTEASIEHTDEDGSNVKINFDGGFDVEIEGLDLPSILDEDSDEDPFEHGEFKISDLNLDVTYTTPENYEVKGEVKFANFHISVDFAKTELDSTVTISFGYDKVAISARFMDVVVLKFESLEDSFFFKAVNYVDKNTKSKYTIGLNSKLGAGLKVKDNAVGFLATVQIPESTGENFFNVLGSDLQFTPLAATVNGKYVDEDQFYEFVSTLIEEMDEKE